MINDVIELIKLFVCVCVFDLFQVSFIHMMRSIVYENDLIFEYFVTIRNQAHLKELQTL